VAFLDNAGDCLQRFQQRIAFDLKKFHDVLLYLVVLISCPSACGKRGKPLPVTRLRAMQHVNGIELKRGQNVSFSRREREVVGYAQSVQHLSTA
jgi:hypothetical protein